MSDTQTYRDPLCTARAHSCHDSFGNPLTPGKECHLRTAAELARTAKPTVPDQVWVERWTLPDPVTVDARDPYVERFWLPILGPSCILTLRRLALMLTLEPAGVGVDVAHLARELGLGTDALRRTLVRLNGFALVDLNGYRLRVRVELPPLSERRVSSLPEMLRLEHADVDLGR
jgi:hypothetical protein